MRDIVTIMKSVGAILEGHFVGTSGLHMATYINKDVLYTHPEATSEVGELFADKYKDEAVEVVVGPALGGIVLAQWTAYHLSKIQNKNVLFAFADKDEDSFILKRGYDGLVQNKKVLVVEDLTTTGGSVKKVAEAVTKAGANVIDVCVMINKDPETVNSEVLGFPFSSLGDFPVPTYRDDDCPLCKANIPINTEVGHGKKFLEEHGRTN